jgi:uncharacterized membrane protein YphA (DoxX/SURF4 family)
MAERRPFEALALTGAIWAARLIVAAVFVAAAVPKIEDPDLFSIDISYYEAFPYWSWNFIAVVVPAMELVGAAAIVSGWKRRAGAAMLGLLNAGFIVLILSVIVRGIDVNCGCFGHGGEQQAIGWWEFWRDVALMAGIAIAGLRTPSERETAAG